jgi:hypothetical protein
MNIQRRACYAFAVAAFFGLSAGAHAETQWDRDHPRHDQVNTRIHEEHREAAIHRAPPRDMHQPDHALRGDEHRMSEDHGHPDEHGLNHPENGVSHEFGR